MKHLVVADVERLAGPWLARLNAGREDQVAVLPLGEATVELPEPQEGKPDVEIVWARPHVKAAAHAAKQKFVSFIADWPNRYRRHGRSFKELLTYRGEVSLWWLTRTRMKDTEGSQTFNRLFQLELIAAVAQAGSADKVYLVSGDPIFRDLVRQWAVQRGIELSLEPKRARRWARSAPFANVASRIKFVAEVAVSFTLVRLLGPLFNEGPDDRGEAVFFTFLGGPLTVGAEGLRELNYVELPEYLGERLGLRPLYATFAYGHIGYFLRNVRRLVAQSKQLVLLEKHVTLCDLLGLIFDWRVPARFLAYQLFDRSFRASFPYNGLDIHGLLRRELRRSYIGPELLEGVLWMKAAERLARQRAARYVFSFLELYPHGLAVYAGSKRGRPDVTTVAYQHAAITDMKLWYCAAPSEIAADGDTRWGMDVMPSPDVFLCQGEMGQRVILANGYPPERCYLTGSPRYDDLSGAALSEQAAKDARRSAGIDEQTRMVLVATPLARDDVDLLLRITAEACASQTDWTVVFKPHPTDSPERISKELRAHGAFCNWRVLGNALHELIGMCDAVVTTYSTTADEAVALDRPVVIVQRDATFSLGTFWSIEAAPTAGTASELREALETQFERPGRHERYRANWPELIRATFHRVDGLAKARIAQVLEGLPKPDDVSATSGQARPDSVPIEGAAADENGTSHEGS